MPSPPLAAIQPRDLRLLRQVRGLTLADVAAEVGIDASLLSRIETGQRPLSPDVEIRLLRVFFGQPKEHTPA